ncbi:VOC family protein [Paucilactobacillus kaifaensis]|uniref:VOC family protein n=1 Tax=Paucilactobacillus kaifaensis TaxID=2559921 RepID=UPI001484D46D|nr:VOC family protein [Paucilactobacillus kaifaensis]
MNSNLQVMLYVNDVEKIATFFEQALDAKIIATNPLPEGFKQVTLAINDGAQISLFSVSFIKKYSPEVSLEIPSLMFLVADVNAARNKMLHFSSDVGEIVDNAGQPAFNFRDPEGHYFAIGRA